jgi:hypothetical protein
MRPPTLPQERRSRPRWGSPMATGAPSPLGENPQHVRAHLRQVHHVLKQLLHVSPPARRSTDGPSDALRQTHPRTIGLNRTKSCTDLCAVIAPRWYRHRHPASSVGDGEADEHLLSLRHCIDTLARQHVSLQRLQGPDPLARPSRFRKKPDLPPGLNESAQGRQFADEFEAKDVSP